MTPCDVMSEIRDRFLLYPFQNIRSMKEAGKITGNERFSNLGYPIGLLVCACIELVGSLIYENNCSTDQFAYYMRIYMGEVNELYKVQFSKQYVTRDGKVRDSNLSNILYGYFRSKLAHSANAIVPLPIDAKEENARKHLMMQGNGSILVHAYELFEDFNKSLEILNKRLIEDDELLSRITRNITAFDAEKDRTSKVLKEVFSSPCWTKDRKSLHEEYPKQQPSS